MKKKLFYICVFFLSCVWISCNYFSEVCLFKTTKLAIPIEVPTDNLVKVIFVDKHDNLKVVDNKDEIKKFVYNDFLTFEVLANQLNPILFYYNDSIVPMGCLYPYSVNVTEYGGFMANCLFRLLNENESFSIKQKKEFATKVNWNKFFEQLEKFEDPWKLDQDRILNDISMKNLNAKSFGLKGTSKK